MSNESVDRLPNDLGGLASAPFQRTDHELLPWEKRCHALADVLDYHKLISTEEKRRGVEALGADLVNNLTYYERWAVAFANLLFARQVITPDELAKKMQEMARRLEVRANAAEEVHVNELIVDKSLPPTAQDATVKAARAFYDFWNTGNTAYLKMALDANFTDRTLPPGRPQGPEGPAFASRQFRAAVPDLEVDVEKMIVKGEYVTVHMVFTGHFSGKFGATQGAGQPIRFIATDLLRVHDGRVTDNWHIEDNLTLFQQMGVAKVGS